MVPRDGNGSDQKGNLPLCVNLVGDLIKFRVGFGL